MLPSLVTVIGLPVVQCSPTLYPSSQPQPSPQPCGPSTAPQPTPDCNDMSLCYSVLNGCVSKANGNVAAECQCRGDFDQCLASLGCPYSVIQDNVVECEKAGCAVSVCTPT